MRLLRDPAVWFIFLLLAFSFYACTAIKSIFRKYAKVKSWRGYTGEQIARYLMDDQRFRDIKTVSTIDVFTSHFDSQTKTIKLAPYIYKDNSIAAVALSALEVGHVLQQVNNYWLYKLRNLLSPVAGFLATLSVPLYLVGVFAGLYQLTNFGILCLQLALIFPFLFISVELNAKNRAILTLQERRLINDKEVVMVKEILSVAVLYQIAQPAAFFSVIYAIVFKKPAKAS